MVTAEGIGVVPGSRLLEESLFADIIIILLLLLLELYSF